MTFAGNDESKQAKPDSKALLPLLLKPHLDAAEFELTTACPCRCVTCGSNCGRAADNELTTDELFRVLSELKDLGCQRVSFLGGEPLCRPDLMRLIKEARARRMLVEVITSGTGLDPTCARQLKDAGVNSVTVSVDGLRSSHDAQRGSVGAHAQAIKAISALRAARISAGVTTQVNRMSLPELESMGDELLGAGAIGWQLQPTLPMGRAAGSPLILEEQDMPELLATLRRLARRTKLRPIITDALGWWTTDDPRLRSADGALSRCWLGCFAGIRHLGITSCGDVKGCMILPAEFVEGNLRNETLRQIWEDPQRFAYNRQYRPGTGGQSVQGTGGSSNCSFTGLKSAIGYCGWANNSSLIACVGTLNSAWIDGLNALLTCTTCDEVSYYLNCLQMYCASLPADYVESLLSRCYTLPYAGVRSDI